MKLSHISLFVLSAVFLVSCGSSQDATVTQRGTTTKAVAYPASVQSIITLQLKDPDSVLKLDCNSYDEAGKKYCTDEKAKMTALKNEITWESVLKKGPAFIKTFDCKTIVSPVGQKYCTDYQATPTTPITPATPATPKPANK